MHILQELSVEEVIEKFENAVSDMAADLTSGEQNLDDAKFVRQYAADNETKFVMLKTPSGIFLVRWDLGDKSAAQFHDDDDGWNPLPTSAIGELL